MKIAGCVVLFNPEKDCFKNILSYLNLLDRLYVLDNSTEYNYELIDLICKFNNVEYISLNGNKGIAYALKLGVGKAIAGNYDFCLTMDQDSSFPKVIKEDIVTRLSSISNIEDFGIISLNYNGNKIDKKLVEVSSWITSGNFIVIKNYKLINGFNEQLFIDYVDFDLNEQFSKINKKIAYWNDLSINHKIGNPKRYNFLGFKFTVMNHSAIRLYYRFRNSLYLYKQNKKFYKKLYYHNLFVDIPKILFFEKYKIEKFRMIKKGRKDAKNGILGEFKI